MIPFLDTQSYNSNFKFVVSSTLGTVDPKTKDSLLGPMIYDYLVLGANDESLKKKGDDEKLWVLFIGAPQQATKTTLKIGDEEKTLETFSSKGSESSNASEAGKEGEKTPDWKFEGEDKPKCSGSEGYSFYKHEKQSDGKPTGLGWNDCKTDLAEKAQEGRRS
ncbi:hypothetical protein MHLP_03580 [Candidatus Mycoplasma haematolamae str. Purdue]|uniref:Uncharacterized protein n=1 Tax=Mycoplasma haematolamae (strain Purdue) TaxID=1212765 RepID=I7CGA9_MYCHA|nr:hypothetical protein [Candidatus Mycoplasma haematolamae]AFO52296.1 hypothetical protein MHLP_03580 [Candidatus Mycoplasma haematolamae str. Purdue]